MSNGFTGSTTKSMSEKIVHEVETRTKKLDIFTDDFNPPGTAELIPGQDVTKTSNNFQEKHTDGTKKGFPETQKIKREMAAAGLIKDQEPLNKIDQEQQEIEAPIKPYKDQYPGSLLKSVSDKVEKKLAHQTKATINTDWGCVLIEFDKTMKTYAAVAIKKNGYAAKRSKEFMHVEDAAKLAREWARQNYNEIRN